MEVINVQKRNFTMKAKQLRRAGFVPGNGIVNNGLVNPCEK